jgi:curved DNA-binding protein
MEYQDYYQTLGVDRKASEKEIKRAFRKLAREYHPDVNPGDKQAEERFKSVNEAHEVLSDPEKRAKYDQLGSAYQDYQRGGGQPGGFNWRQWTTGAPGAGGAHARYGHPDDLQDIFGGGGAFSDFFSQIFGGMGRGGGQPGGYQYQARPQRGRDYVQPVQITLAEAYHGTTRALEKDGRRLQVKIPAGAKTGTRVRMTGEGGGGGGGGPAGDLYLKIEVLPDSRFERDGDDLRTTVAVDLYTPILGGQAEVPTLSGNVSLTIPAGTQNGRVFRLRGKGMTVLGRKGAHGDLLAKIEVQLPATVSPRERELFSELRSMSAGGT